MMQSSPLVDDQEGIHAVLAADGEVHGVIAIHSTALGPAAGGCRVWDYASTAELTADAVRLAQGMSYKNALAGLPFGGGKAVLRRPANPAARAELFRLFAAAVDRLEGSYITAEDVGTSVADMSLVAGLTPYVAGLDALPGLAGGDPSPLTALGVYKSMEEAAWLALGGDLHGLRVAIQGVGNVGAALARLLHQAGAQLVISDVDQSRAAALAAELRAQVVPVEKILGAECDILAPCALGGVLTPATIPALRAKIICGGANNQLASAGEGAAIAERGITYCPDYLVNAGGIINVAAEYLGESRERVVERIASIPLRLREVLATAIATGLPTNVIADDLARDIIAGRPPTGLPLPP